MRPVIGARLTCTSNTDMKMLTCFVRPGHTSPSAMSLICTTVPSAGESTSTRRSEPARCGSRKKLKRNSVTRPRTIAAVYHWMSSAAAVKITAGMMNSHPSGAKRMRDMGRIVLGNDKRQSSKFKVQICRLNFELCRLNFRDEKKRAPKAGAPQSSMLAYLHANLIRFVGSDARCHLVLQMEFPLL